MLWMAQIEDTCRELRSCNKINLYIYVNILLNTDNGKTVVNGQVCANLDFANILFTITVNQPDTQCFMIEFIHNTWWLDMFRTSMVHPQERL